jgi:hypothetical protein
MVLALAAVVRALDGNNGYQPNLLFTAADVRAQVQYDASFTGVRWDTLNSMRLGSLWSNRVEMALGSGGNLFLMVEGDGHTGIVRYDGTSFLQLVQIPPSGQQGIRKIAMSPVTHGLLTKDHPVYLVKYAGVPGLEIVTVDPGTPPFAEVHVHSFASGTYVREFDVGADGRIYALTEEEDILVLAYDAASGGYVESVLGTDAPIDAGLNRLDVGPDGMLYALGEPELKGDVVSSEPPPRFLQIDPDSGAWSEYGTLHKDVDLVHDWAWGSEGRLWVTITDYRKRGARYYIAELAPGGTTDFQQRIAESNLQSLSILGGPAGKLYVTESDSFGLADDIFELAPGSGGGDDGGTGGGGKGGGKGKNK